jgi:hypothetical protein
MPTDDAELHIITLMRNLFLETGTGGLDKMTSVTRMNGKQPAYAKTVDNIFPGPVMPFREPIAMPCHGFSSCTCHAMPFRAMPWHLRGRRNGMAW